MFRKTSKLLMILISLGLILLPIVIYFSFYDIDKDHVEKELGKFLNSDRLRVVETEPLQGQEDKYIVVYYSIDSSNGVSLIRKGIHNKYQIIDAYESNDGLTCVDYDIDDQPYYVLFGQVEKSVDKLVVETFIKSTTEKIDSDYVFLVREGLFSNGKIRVHYMDGSEETIRTNGSINRSSRSRATIPVIGTCFFAFIICYTFLISNGDKYNNYDKSLYDNDQRLKQMQP